MYINHIWKYLTSIVISNTLSHAILQISLITCQILYIPVEWFDIDQADVYTIIYTKN